MSCVPRLRPGAKSLIGVDNHSYIVFIGHDTLTASMEFQPEDVQPESQQLVSVDVVEEAVENLAGALPSQAAQSSVERSLPAPSVAAASESRPAPLQQSGLISPPRERRGMPCQGQASSLSPANALLDAPIESVPGVLQLASGVTQSASAPARRVGADMLRDNIPAADNVRKRWTTEEEERLIDGQERYGNRWEHIRKNCQLQHCHGTQIRDKWVNLLKAGKVRPRPY